MLELNWNTVVQRSVNGYDGFDFDVIVLQVLGSVLLCLGAWFLLIPANQDLLFVMASDSTRYYINLCMLIVIATGIFTIVFAHVGCCGAVSNSKRVLGMVRH